MSLFNKYLEAVAGGKVHLVSQREAYLTDPSLKAKLHVSPAIFFDPATQEVDSSSFGKKWFKDDKVFVKGLHSNEIYTIPKSEYEYAKSYWEKMNTSSSSVARRDDEEIRGAAERTRAMRDQKMINAASVAAEKTRF